MLLEDQVVAYLFNAVKFIWLLCSQVVMYNLCVTVHVCLRVSVSCELNVSA